jgi:hypothetical protein
LNLLLDGGLAGKKHDILNICTSATFVLLLFLKLVEYKKCYIFSGLGVVGREGGVVQGDQDDAEMGGSVQGCKRTGGSGGKVGSASKTTAEACLARVSFAGCATIQNCVALEVTVSSASGVEEGSDAPDSSVNSMFEPVMIFILLLWNETRGGALFSKNFDK